MRSPASLWHTRLMRVRLPAIAALVSTLIVPPVALAVDAPPTTEPNLVERARSMLLTISRGHARMRVVTELGHAGVGLEPATFRLPVPRGGVVTGLRTSETRNGRVVWHEGELVAADLAAARYDDPSNTGGATDAALLSWSLPGYLALRVAPRPQRRVGVGYDVELPTEWVDGRERVVLDPAALGSGRATATVRTDVAGGRIFVDGAATYSGYGFALDEAHLVEVEPPRGQEIVEGRLAAVPLGPERALVVLRFAAPKRITEVPLGARIVVVLDTSRSLSPDDVRAEMRAAHAYLAHFEGKDARVALVAFDRHARDLTRGFVAVAAARALLDGPAWPRANGSAIDEAVARAAILLARVPTRVPKRVIVLGDLLARRGVEPTHIAPPPGAIVHVASVTSSGASVRRIDDHPWAALPRATGGLLFRATAPHGAARRATDREVVEKAFLEWARPVRVDHMVWRVPGSPGWGEDPGVLEEGESVTYRAVQPTSPTSATLEGELWSRRLEKTIVPSSSEGAVWSALVFGTDLVHDLSDDEVRSLARAAGAASPATSYVVAGPGVRRSRTDDDIRERFEAICCKGFPGVYGRGSGPEAHHRFLAPDYQRVFAAWMKRAVRRCGAEGRTRISAETTLGEIVDVHVDVSGDAPDGSQASCVREATWALELPEELGHPHLDLRATL